MSTQTEDRPPAVPEDTIGNRLILARALAGHLSIREAALKCGIGRGSWQNWERGLSEPRLSQVKRIADVLVVRFDWLANGGPLADPENPGGPTTGQDSDTGLRRIAA